MDMTKTLAIVILLILMPARYSMAGDIYLLTNRDYFPVLEDKINRSGDEIMVSMYLFRTTENRKNLATRLRDSLINAASRGVKVTVLLEREKGGRKGSSLNEDNNYTAKVLLRGGVKVYFDDPETVTHTKLATIDRRFVFIGSHNFSDSALRHNNEASVMIDSPQVAKEASSYMRGNLR